jgi:hypothetical protein
MTNTGSGLEAPARDPEEAVAAAAKQLAAAKLLILAPGEVGLTEPFWILRDE